MFHCDECLNYRRGRADLATGYRDPDDCQATDLSSYQLPEALSDVLTNIMFVFSEMASQGKAPRCPMWRDKYAGR